MHPRTNNYTSTTPRTLTPPISSPTTPLASAFPMTSSNTAATSKSHPKRKKKKYSVCHHEACNQAGEAEGAGEAAHTALQLTVGSDAYTRPSRAVQVTRPPNLANVSFNVGVGGVSELGCYELCSVLLAAFVQ